ncbi:MAG: nuclear transport factor 2 family protein [Myxococcales bacterium]|nr:MAG: nuclear transport factor 2 family protein [Myxococcales bacterium]
MTEPHRPGSPRPRTALAALEAHLDLITRDIAAWLDLFADDAIVEFPYSAGLGVPGRLAGKEAIRGYFAGTPHVFVGLTMSDARLRATEDPDVAVGEAHGSATIATTGRAYEQEYVFVLTFREGLIRHYREYWNPVVALEAMGGQEGLAALEARMSAHGAGGVK